MGHGFPPALTQKPKKWWAGFLTCGHAIDQRCDLRHSCRWFQRWSSLSTPARPRDGPSGGAVVAVLRFHPGQGVNVDTHTGSPAYGVLMKNDRRLRRLVVDDITWRWTVRQRVKSAYEDCRLTLSLYPEGTRRRLALVFRPGSDRIISNCYFDPGALVRLPDRSYLNLYEPGTVRRLLDAAASPLDLFASKDVIEVDGWQYFDAVVEPVTVHSWHRPERSA